jgi:hypothetical protein
MKTFHSISLLLALAALLGLAPAWATLGEGAAGVEANRLQLRASLATRVGARYTVHELKLASGTMVREYADPAGMVFAVAWNGPVNPDLRSLLGARNHASLLAAADRSHSGLSRRTVREGTLVVKTGGHMRSLHGLAWLTDRIPAGVKLDALQ